MPTLELILPVELSGASMRDVAQAVADGCPNGLPETVSIDFRSLNFIKPAGITYLSNLIKWLEGGGVSVVFVGNTLDRAAVRFLDDSQFFKRHRGANLNVNARPRHTTRPLMDIHHERSQVWVRSDLIPWLAGALDISRTSLHTLQVSVLELFNNIKDHSTLEIGSICAQHFPNMSRVGIAVGDLGRGIPEVVRSVFPDLSDDDAIQQAVSQGFTTGSEANRGDGLAYLLDTAVVRNGGEVTIYSLKGAIAFSRVDGAVNATPVANVGFCPGTTIDIWLRTDTIENLPDETEDFAW